MELFHMMEFFFCVSQSLVMYHAFEHYIHSWLFLRLAAKSHFWLMLSAAVRSTAVHTGMKMSRRGEIS